MADDVTVEILKQIRDGITAVNRDLGARVDRTNQEIGQLREDTNTRAERVEQRLERVEQGLLDLGRFMKDLALSMASYERFHAHHVEVLEKDLDDVKARLRRIEE